MLVPQLKRKVANLIPLRFFKIVVWLNAAGEKKTTAFILSQEDLAGGIQFEELQFDQEFKEHQCSIDYLEGITDLKFTAIRDWDTFSGATPETQGVERPDRNSLNALKFRCGAFCIFD